MGLFLLAIVGGILNRMGGSDKYNTKWRDIGVPVVMILAMTYLGLFNASLILSSLLLFGSLTTYWDKDENNNVTMKGWFLTGLKYGLAMLPYAIQTVGYLAFLLRTSLLAVLVPAWMLYVNEPVWKWDGAVVQEFGRGFFIIITLGLLCR